MLEAVVVFALITTKVTERIRTAFTLDGWVVNLVAIAIGVAFAFGFDLKVVAEVTGIAGAGWLDAIVTGVGIGSGAGWFADLAGRSGPRSW